MTVFIVDTNIVFSTFLNLESTIGDLLLSSSDVFEFYAPAYLQEEILNHQSNIQKLARLDEREFNALKQLIFSNLTFLSDQIIPFDVWYESAQLVRDVDPDDIAFVAYSKYYDKDIWTGDKKFIQGMAAKGFKKLITTRELVELRAKLRSA